jgi:hypothetical protein
MTKEKREAIRERLQMLADQNNGRITPDIVVADAKKKTSPLHDQFEWDAKKAASQYWVYQARQLIKSVKVMVTNETRSVSTVCYVRDPSVESAEQGYISLPKLKSDHELSRDALLYEFDRAASALKRARNLAEALDMLPEVEEIVRDISAFRDRAVTVEIKTVQ